MRNFINIINEYQSEGVTTTPEFRQWFRNSKVVDQQGKPLMVFHGGPSGITAFDKNKIGQTFGQDKEGFFFTTNTAYDIAHYGTPDGKTGQRVYNDMYAAGAYADNAEGGGVYPCYLRIENPLMIGDWAEWNGLDLDYEVSNYGHVQDVLDRNKRNIIGTAREGNYDGVIASHGRDHVFVVFEPNQIKSIFNKKFSDSDNISESD